MQGADTAGRVLRFALVGLSGVGVNLGLVWVGMTAFAGLGTDTREALASALGIGGSILSNFVLHDGWTWGDRRKGAGPGAWLARLGRFTSVSGVAAAVQFGVAWAARAFLDADVYLAQVLGVVLGAGINYVANHLWTFREADP